LQLGAIKIERTTITCNLVDEVVSSVHFVWDRGL